jgi:hypothetical protein
MIKTLTILSAALALALPAYADDAHHPETQKDKPAAAAKAPAKTPKSQQAAGNGMDCPMHKGGMGMGGMGMMGAEHEAMMSRMQQMEKRMDMMQMMMEQMMKSQAAPAK